MGISWTKEQQDVIKLRDRNILVSAAAGSGKTAVLVERIITRLTKEKVNIDELLIVTFTEAAAAEMKERILSAVEKELKEYPDDEHLQRQTALVHNANIMTTHSFCLGVIKNYFYKIDLDPIFRAGDEGELKLIKSEILEKLFENEYSQMRDSFLNLVETYATGKKDSMLLNMVERIFTYSRSTPQPNVWLDECCDLYHFKSKDEFYKSPIGLAMLDHIRQELYTLHELITLAMEQNEYVGLKRMFSQDAEIVEPLLKIYNFVDLEPLIKSFAWPRMSYTNQEKEELDGADEEKNGANTYRTSYKKKLTEIKDKFFKSDMDEHLKYMDCNHHILKELVRLVKEFEVLYSGEKRKRHLIDYSDMEQFALQILNYEKNGKLVPSEVAIEYQDKFKEIMIDEYQDSNLVQEAILTSVARVHRGEYNIFMVGDVKQSIYSFRLSRPELFIDKFDTYSLEDGNKQRIDLHQNFRSRAEVLDGTNHVFYKCMKSDLGEITYDEKSALHVGANFPESQGNEMELRIIDMDELSEEVADKGLDFELDKLHLEARDVALRIKTLMNEHQVLDKKSNEYRPIQYKDIVILTRAKSGWNETFGEVLEEENIPVDVENISGYYDCWEISILLNYLAVIDNPRQDIPLAGALTSVFGQVTSEELAIIKTTYPERAFTSAVMAYANREEECELQKKLELFMNRLNYYRDMNTYASIHELLYKIVEDTGYRHYVFAMNTGEQRVANVEQLLQQALDYQRTSFKGVFNFIRYVEQLKKYKVDLGQAAKAETIVDRVQVMTIHKSKGLEFPVVFLVGAGKQFNERDNRDALIIHPELGIGIDYVNHKNREKYATLHRNVITNKKKLDNKGEELRILYVAMTRAKEKLIITGSTKDVKKQLNDIKKVSKETTGALSYYQRAKARTYLEWILPSVFHLKQFHEFANTYEVTPNVEHPDRKLDIPFKMVKVSINELVNQKIEEIELYTEKSDALEFEILENQSLSVNEQNGVKEKIEFKYSYSEEADYKIKVSVTELKNKKYDIESQNEAQSLSQLKSKTVKNTSKIVPEFIKGESIEINYATERGNAFHRFMEIWDYTSEPNREIIEQFLAESIESGKIKKEYGSYLELDKVFTCLNSSIGKRMRDAALAKNLFKEQPFVLGIPAREVYGGDSEETIILQGVIDVFFIEDDQVIIMDYKTDGVKSPEVLVNRYQEQLELYGRAVKQITGRDVKEKIIYSFAQGSEIVL